MKVVWFIRRSNLADTGGQGVASGEDWVTTICDLRPCPRPVMPAGSRTYGPYKENDPFTGRGHYSYLGFTRNSNGHRRDHPAAATRRLVR